MNIAGANTKMQKEFNALGYTGKDCVFAVLDTAVGEVGKLKGKIEYADTYRIDDKNNSDHGTFVSGQLIDWAPDATILSYCVFPNGSGTAGKVNVALSDVLSRAKKDTSRHYFVNMSLGNNVGKNVMTPYIALMQSLIKQLTEINVPVFVAAGNDGSEQLYIYPSRFQEPICVGAANPNGTRASFSVFHDELDFIDAGVDIFGINRNGLPTFMSGTSMACPNLLGKAALLACRMADVTGQWPTEMQLYNELKECAIDCETIGYDKQSGFGFVDIRNADGIFKVTDSVEKPQTWQSKVRESITVIRNLLKQNGFMPSDVVSDATYSKVIKLGSTGNDVKKVKDRLVELGYLHASTKYTFGNDTLKAVKNFQKDHNLKVDGVVGILTWNELFGEDQDVDGGENNNLNIISSDKWTRNLAYGISGEDVKAAKDRLVELGFLSKSTHALFGNDTKSAVMQFQGLNNLTPTGIIDQTTWEALFSNSAKVPEEIDTGDIPENISRAKAAQIAAELKNVSQARKNLVLDALQFAVDPDNLPIYMLSFYGRGKNLYNKDLSLNIATLSAMKSYFNNSNYAPYYDGGRQEVMEKAALSSSYTTSWADCSGGVVGLLRKHCTSVDITGIKKAVSSGFDANANTLFSKYSNETTSPKPGDFVWKPGHIGIYCGSGICVEWCGGAYGCAASVVANRRVYSFLDHKLHKMSDWEAFGSPVFFTD